MKFAYISQVIAFVAFHTTGMTAQLNKLLQQSQNGEFSSVLNVTDIVASPLPLYFLQFILITLASTMLFIVSQAHFSVFLSQKLDQHISNDKLTFILWAFISNSALFIANSAWFTHSQHLTQSFYTWPAIHLNTYACLIILCLPVAFYVWQHKSSRVTQVFMVSLIIITTAFYISSHKHQTFESFSNQDRPNVIIIGVDSLRSDLLASHMPYLSEQLKGTIQFENAITPLGRTFPAWNSILTGLYPVNHGARINLINESNLVSSDHYLASILKEQGYKTLFAMDETRFANMGNHQGFDDIITPRTGASDFLIASVADYPITNLLSLLPISSWLMPEVYGNRGAATTYRAEAFSEILQRKIPVATQPSFLNVHFCLAHWPYHFASKFKPEPGYPEPYYPANLRAVDEQIKTLMNDLKNKGYLENSRVIFLSDHGESWVEESPTFNNVNGAESEFPQQKKKEYGHGSSLTGNSNNITLAFKGFEPIALTQNTKKLVTLADLKPTILDELNIQVNQVNDGQSLLSSDLPGLRYIPVETGTVITVDAEDMVNIQQLMEDLLDRYELKPNGLIRIQAEKVAEALKAKVKGIRTINQVLSQEKRDSFRLFDLTTFQFEHFNDLVSLQSKYPKWSEAWCNWYKIEDANCKGLNKVATIQP